MGNRQNIAQLGAYQGSPQGFGPRCNGAHLISLIDDGVWQKSPTGTIKAFDVITPINAQTVTPVPYGTQYMVTDVFSLTAVPQGTIGATLQNRQVADQTQLFAFGGNASGGISRFATGDAANTFAPPKRMAVRVSFDAIVIINSDQTNVLRVLFLVATKDARIDLLTIA